MSLSDVDVLDDALTRTGAALIVVDPLQAYLGADIDMHRANETRPVLAALARLAERYSCAVLLIRHLTKSRSDRAAYRGLGSIDLTAAARSVLLAGRDPRDQGKRAVVQTKNSLTAEGPALGYAIEQDRFVWTGESDLTAAALLAADATEDERSALDEARDWLTEALASGPRRASEIQSGARNATISDATLRRARVALGVTKEKREFAGGGWWWSLRRCSQTENEHVRANTNEQTQKNADTADNSTGAAKLLKPKMLSEAEHLRDDLEEGLIP
ncbi:MAG: AAA family ATPase [Deltaproteobacteria bacterium]|nr:AAA family ATPase [Deltaproteobacteria bacterium]